MPIGTKLMYFATGIDELGRDDNPIDPEFQTNRIFELGPGFYLAETRDTALDYALNAFINKLGNKLSEKYEDGEVFDFNNEKTEVYLYTFEVDFTNLNDYSHIVVKDEEFRKKLTCNILERYRDNLNYKTSLTWTYGPLCGMKWDENVRRDNLSKLTTENINSYLGDSTGDYQLCIHKRLESGLSGNMKYLSCLKRKDIDVFDENYFYAKKEIFEYGTRKKRCIFIKKIPGNIRYIRRISGGDF